ncbi:MAG: hypothetical protein R6U17_04270 [Thermoplasmata archaeon]
MTRGVNDGVADDEEFARFVRSLAKGGRSPYPKKSGPENTSMVAIRSKS